jgi:serine/threonine protein kinase
MENRESCPPSPSEDAESQIASTPGPSWPESSDASEPLPDIPGFTVVRQIGRGANAAVWLARREADRKLYAVKCLPAGEGENKASLEQASREAAFLSVMAHEHLTRIHDVVAVTSSGQGYVGLVMDYAAGGSVADLVAGRGRIGTGEAVTILTPIAQALAHLHDSGLAHGDVSPGNVLFTEHGMPLLGDLGLSRMVGEGGARTAGGTPGFVAPNIGVAQAGDLQPSRDVYALAALGWFCLTGAPPAECSGRPPLPLLVTGVPANLAAALEAGLSQEPQQRPTASEFATAVFRSAAAEPVDLSTSAHPSILPMLLTRRHAKPSRSSRWRAWIGRSGTRFRQQSLRTGTKGAGRSTGLLLAALLVAGLVTIGAVTGTGLSVGSTQAVGTTQGPAAEGMASARPPGGPLERILERLRGEDPLDAAHALAELRSLAIAGADDELLKHVNIPDSLAERSDRETVAELRAAGIVLEGFATSLRRAVLAPGSSKDRAVVSAAATTSAYSEHDVGGNLLAERPAPPVKDLRLVLVKNEGSWKISEVLGPG